MKNITSKVTYTVPHWNFCNNDYIKDGELTNKRCQFCIKTRDGYECLLYNQELSSKGKLINKVRECCKATAGFESTIDATVTTTPSVDPKQLMKLTIDMYTKTVKDLLSQGYPQQIAESIAQQFVLDK